MGRRPHHRGVRELLGGPRILVVKDGGRAVTAFDAEGATTVPARAVDVVEPVGAGDAFAAGFLAGLTTPSLTRALRLGHITAASALTVTDDHGPLPDKPMIRNLLTLTDREWSGAGG